MTVQQVPKYLKIWIVFAAVSFLGCGLAYGLSQQMLRQNANDPQIQIAEDGAQALSNGEDQSTISFPNSQDISKTLSEFIMVFDDSGKLIASSGVLDGKSPQPPAGVLDSARKTGESRITWQPQKDVRLAAVIVHYTGKNSGFIVVARSLKEVEKREAYVGLVSAAAWVLSLILSFVLCFVFWREPKAVTVEVKPEEIKN